MRYLTLDDCPRCPICDGPGIGHAPHTRGGYLRCCGCGHAWFASVDQKLLAAAFTDDWNQRQIDGARALGLLPT